MIYIGGLSQYLPMWVLNTYRYIDDIIDMLSIDIEYIFSKNDGSLSSNIERNNGSSSNTNFGTSIFTHTLPELELNPDDERNVILDYDGPCVNDHIYGIIPMETSKLWKKQEKIDEIEKKRPKKKFSIPEVRYS